MTNVIQNKKRKSEKEYRINFDMPKPYNYTPGVENPLFARS